MAGAFSTEGEGAVPEQLHLPQASAAVLSTDTAGNLASWPPAEVGTCQEALWDEGHCSGYLRCSVHIGCGHETPGRFRVPAKRL